MVRNWGPFPVNEWLALQPGSPLTLTRVAQSGQPRISVQEEDPRWRPRDYNPGGLEFNQVANNPTIRNLRIAAVLAAEKEINYGRIIHIQFPIGFINNDKPKTLDKSNGSFGGTLPKTITDNVKYTL